MSQDLFDIWKELCADFRHAWKTEHRRVAKRKLEAARREKEERLRAAREGKPMPAITPVVTPGRSRKVESGSALGAQLRNKFRKKPVPLPRSPPKKQNSSDDAPS